MELENLFLAGWTSAMLRAHFATFVGRELLWKWALQSPEQEAFR